MAAMISRGIQISLIFCIGVLATLHSAKAAEYPERTVNFIVGYQPGGGPDILARLIGQKLSDKWGQPVVVQNREGADGSIATSYVAHSAPDGYTISMVTNNLSIPPQGYTLNYDPIKSLAAVTEVAYVPDMLLVHPTFPANNLKDFIALVKSKPGVLNFSSNGENTGPYLAMALFMKETGTKLVSVNYKGSAPLAVMNGEVQATFGAVSSSISQVKGGQLKALAISSHTRYPDLPDVPTVEEAANLASFEVLTWSGVVAPAGTPKGVLAKLRSDIATVIDMPDVRKAMTDRGFVIVNNTQDEFAKVIADDYVRWTALRKTLDSK